MGNPTFFPRGTAGIHPGTNAQDIYVVSGSISGSNLILVMSDSTTRTIDVSALTGGAEITGFSFNESTNTLTINEGGQSFSVNLSSLESVADVVGGFAISVTDSNGTHTVALDAGGTPNSESLLGFNAGQNRPQWQSTIAADNIANNTIVAGKLNTTGTATARTFLRGDFAWAEPTEGIAIPAAEEINTSQISQVYRVPATGTTAMYRTAGNIVDINNTQAWGFYDDEVPPDVTYVQTAPTTWQQISDSTTYDSFILSNGSSGFSSAVTSALDTGVQETCGLVWMRHSDSDWAIYQWPANSLNQSNNGPIYLVNRNLRLVAYDGVPNLNMQVGLNIAVSSNQQLSSFIELITEPYWFYGADGIWHNGRDYFDEAGRAAAIGHEVDKIERELDDGIGRIPFPEESESRVRAKKQFDSLNISSTGNRMTFTVARPEDTELWSAFDDLFDDLLYPDDGLATIHFQISTLDGTDSEFTQRDIVFESANDGTNEIFEHTDSEFYFETTNGTRFGTNNRIIFTDGNGNAISGSVNNLSTGPGYFRKVLAYPADNTGQRGAADLTSQIDEIGYKNFTYIGSIPNPSLLAIRTVDSELTGDFVTIGSGLSLSAANVLTSSGGTGGVTVQDEGTALTTTGTTLNFTGAGVTASGTGATKTINVPGGGSTTIAAGNGISVATSGSTTTVSGRTRDNFGLTAYTDGLGLSSAFVDAASVLALDTTYSVSNYTGANDTLRGLSQIRSVLNNTNGQIFMSTIQVSDSDAGIGGFSFGSIPTTWGAVQSIQLANQDGSDPGRSIVGLRQYFAPSSILEVRRDANNYAYWKITSYRGLFGDSDIANLYVSGTRSVSNIRDEYGSLKTLGLIHSVGTPSFGQDVTYTVRLHGADTISDGRLIANGSLYAEKLADSAVETAKIEDDAVTNAKIANNAVQTDNISDLNVTEAKIQNLAVTTGKIRDDAVTNAKMADDAVGIAQLSATGSASASTYLRGDNTWATVSASAASDELRAGTAAITAQGIGRYRYASDNALMEAATQFNNSGGGTIQFGTTNRNTDLNTAGTYIDSDGLPFFMADANFTQDSIQRFTIRGQGHFAGRNFIDVNETVDSEVVGKFVWIPQGAAATTIAGYGVDIDSEGSFLLGNAGGNYISYSLHDGLHINAPAQREPVFTDSEAGLVPPPGNRGAGYFMNGDGLWVHTDEFIDSDVTLHTLQALSSRWVDATREFEIYANARIPAVPGTAGQRAWFTLTFTADPTTNQNNDRPLENDAVLTIRAPNSDEGNILDEVNVHWSQNDVAPGHGTEGSNDVDDIWANAIGQNYSNWFQAIDIGQPDGSISIQMTHDGPMSETDGNARYPIVEFTSRFYRVSAEYAQPGADRGRTGEYTNNTDASGSNATAGTAAHDSEILIIDQVVPLASTSAAGLGPARPTSNATTQFLRGDGTYASISDSTTIRADSISGEANSVRIELNSSDSNAVDFNVTDTIAWFDVNSSNVRADVRNGSIDSDLLADDAVTLAKLNAGTGTAGQVLARNSGNNGLTWANNTGGGGVSSVFTSSANGLVPAPGDSDSEFDFLAGNGTWQKVGQVIGSNPDDVIAKFNTGSVIAGGLVRVSNQLTLVRKLVSEGPNTSNWTAHLVRTSGTLTRIDYYEGDFSTVANLSASARRARKTFNRTSGTLTGTPVTTGG